ncbi:MAG: tetratricopeptide repeat protein [Candidatus Thiodiazotropha sp. DIVDIV]
MKKLFLLMLFTIFPLGSLNAAVAMSTEVLALSESWAEIKYQMPEDQRVEALEKLTEKAETLVKDNPGTAEPIVWHAIIVSTLAGEKGGLGALSLVKEAKKLLERAEAFDPDVLNGSVYTSLGSLYYQVPGWPIGFGSDDKAKSYLKKALAVNPNGMDPNYFYGDFLLQEGEYSEAVEVLTRALAAPARDSRPIADAGRRAEIEEALKKVKLAMQ